jgi:tetratricopeptide (TPR) repeat protein
MAQSRNESDLNTIGGTVRDAGGNPVAAVTISLFAAGTSALTARTDPDGKYSFSALGQGSYTLRAEKVGYSTITSATLVLGRGDAKRVDLVFQSQDGSQGQRHSLGTPEFSDDPSFTVAGVTDATALGGHGSNTVMRTKESLAKDTVSLSNKSPGIPMPSSSTEEKMLREKAEHVPSDFTANSQLGQFLLDSGRIREAVPYLERASQLNPNDHRNSYQLATAYARSGEYERARTSVRALLARQDKAELHHLLGDVEESLHNPVAAVQEYQRAAELEPSEANLFDWGAELLLHHAPEPAIQVFTKGNRLFPRSVRMLAGLGAAWYAQGSFEQAAQRLCEASDLDPNDPHPYLFLGKLQSVDNTRSDRFVERLARFAKLQPENPMANYYYALSLWKQRKGPEDTAVSGQVELLLEKAGHLSPALGAAYMQLGILYSERGDASRALSNYQKAVAASPQSEEAHYRLAQAYKRTGKNAEAQKELQIYAQLSKKTAEESERRRHEIQQFVYTLRERTAVSQPQ